LIAGVGVLHAIRQIAGVAASLKWPNDVLVGHRKVAGILCESTGIGSPSACVIVGIGINVNMAQKDLPEEINDCATSLASETGRQFSRAELVAVLLNDLEPRFETIASEIPRSAVEEYASLCSTLGRDVKVTLASGEIVEGYAGGLTSEGALSVIPHGTCQPRPVYAADVIHVRRAPYHTGSY